MSPYGPYADIAELLRAAGVAMADVDAYTTAQLLERARLRRETGKDARPPKPMWTTRSIRVPWEVEHEADRKARASGSNFNAVVGRLLGEYIKED